MGGVRAGPLRAASRVAVEGQTTANPINGGSGSGGKSGCVLEVAWSTARRSNPQRYGGGGGEGGCTLQRPRTLKSLSLHTTRGGWCMAIRVRQAKTAQAHEVSTGAAMHGRERRCEWHSQRHGGSIRSGAAAAVARVAE